LYINPLHVKLFKKLILLFPLLKSHNYFITYEDEGTDLFSLAFEYSK